MPFINVIREILSYPFLARAIVTGILIALCSALLGVSLVLKRYAMIGDGLSHVSFGALAFAMAMNWAPFAVSIPVVLLASFLLLRLSDKSSIRGDSALAMISSSALAIGVIAVSWGKGMSTDVCNYMFGSILATSPEDVKLTILLSVLVISALIFFYPRLFAITFDEDFARASGLPASFYNMLLAALTSITIVLGMRMMGALLISSLIIFPALSSMRVFKSFKAVMISSATISVVAFITGFVLSYLLRTPSGASIVVVNLAIFLVMSMIRLLRPHLREAREQKVKTALLILLSCLFILPFTACGKREEGSLTKQIEQAENASGKVQETDDLIRYVENPTEATEAKLIQPQTLPEYEEGEEIFIDEKMYIGWVLDIYSNVDKYLGRPVKIRGMFSTFRVWSEDQYVVFRWGPGCCGDDGGMCGFEITIPEGRELPEDQSWIEVHGIVEQYIGGDGLKYIRINSESIEACEPEEAYALHY